VTAINGLPAHVLLVHFVVVLAPLTALSEMLCALWPAARRRLVWPVLALAVATLVLTPITTDAGEWLYDVRKQPSGILREHAERGGWMIYFSVAMLVVAVVIAVLHVLEARSDKRRVAANIVVAILAGAVAISSIVTVYRIGDSGAQSVWGGEIARLKKATGG
jgi:predicted lysophospholipase L1 biosynthesis ABC-type transport system permease subunit